MPPPFVGRRQEAVAVKKLLLSVVVGLAGVAGNPAFPGDATAQGFRRESVEIAFDRHKGELYRLYRLALRDRPDLKGQIVLEIDIDRAGVPTRCRVRSSQLDSPDLENKLCERVRLFRFDTQGPATFVKEIWFHPAK
jgi:hypothetical protein